MPFDPTSPLAFAHKQYRSLESQFIALNLTGPITGPIQVANNSSWLNVTLWGVANFVDGTPRTYNYQFKLTSQADLLTQGNYQTTVTFKYYRDEIGFPEVTETFDVNLTIEETIKLAITRSTMNISYTVGGAAPATEFFKLETENPWTALVSDARVSLNHASGSGSTDMEMDLDVSGLPIGNYSYSILFDDGYDKVTLEISLQVINENTANDYLIVSPESFQLAVQEGSLDPSSRAFTVDSSADFTLAANQPWILLSSLSELAGTRSITAITQNTDGLAPGLYSGEITVTSSFTVKKIAIALLVNETGSSGVDPDTLYFSDDRDRITLASISSNKELVLKYDINGSKYNYEKTLPFINGIGKALLGDVANNLVEHKELFANMGTRVFVPVDPLSMVVTAYDKPINSTQLNERQVLSGILMLTGATPKTLDRLTYSPGTVVTSPKGIVAFSFRSDTPPDEIIVAGAVDASVVVGNIGGPIYTCFVNLSEFTLVEGDEISITCGGQVLKVVINGHAPEETHICWLNEWNCPEFATMQGHLVISKSTDKIQGKYADDGKEITRILEIKKTMEYTLNTGFISGRDYYKYYASILDAKKIWLYVDGQWEEVISTNKRMRTYGTREYFMGYPLTFKPAVI